MSNPPPPPAPAPAPTFSQSTHDCARCHRFAAPANSPHCADCACAARREANSAA